MNAIEITGNTSSLIPGEARHVILRWAFNKQPTTDSHVALQRLIYSLHSPGGEVLYNRDLSLMPDVNAWDILVEVPPNYKGKKITLFVENEQQEEKITARFEIIINNLP